MAMIVQQPLFRAEAEPTVQPGGEDRSFKFHDVEDLKAIAQSLDLVEPKRTVTADGIRFPDEVGLVFRTSQAPIKTVSRDFRIHQNRDVLLHAASIVEDMKLEPHGTVFESMHGHMLAKIFVANPEYELELALNHDLERSLVTLGLAIQNAYGRPHVGLQAEAIGHTKDQVLYLSRTIGRVSIRHIGPRDELTPSPERRERGVRRVMDLLLQRAPVAARRIEEATHHMVAEEDVIPLLRSLGLTPKTTTTLIAAGPSLARGWQASPTAWTLYTAMCNVYATKDVSPVKLDEVRRRAESLLYVRDLERLIAKGRSIQAKERLDEDAELLEATLE